MRALCPGSFDPITLGHLDIIGRACGLFDEVLVGVGRNTTKNALFDTEQRIELIERSTAELTGANGVRALAMSGLLVDFCQAHDVQVVVKGVRGGADFDHELQMAQLNERMAERGGHRVETVVLPASIEVGFISSTMVREVATLGGDVTQFVPAPVAEALRARNAG